MITSSPTFGRDVDDIDVLVEDPIFLLLQWLPPNSSELRPLMTLSSIDEFGYPDSRNVLVSKADPDGLHFHTDSSTRKFAELTARPRACAALVWPDVGRQLVIAGDVEREPAAEAEATFRARSRYLQLLAWQNSAELAHETLATRRARWAAFDAGHADGSLAPPTTWVGFVLRPLRLTFWRGDPDGPSNRVEYRRAADGWTITKLPG